MTRSIHHYLVEICKFANFGTVSESFEVVRHRKLKYEKLGIDLKIPPFSFELSNERGVNRRKWKESDVVRIRKNGAVVYVGSIGKVKPVKEANQAVIRVSGTHYYYRRLIDTYLTTPGIASNWSPYRFGRKSVNDGSDLGVALDGLNPKDIVEVVTGNRLVVQEFFDNMDNLDTADWLKRPTDFTDLSSNVTNADFEGATSWTYGENNDTVYVSAGNPFSDGGYSSTISRSGTQSYKINFTSGGTPSPVDGAYIYQDGVTLAPGDVLHAYVARLNNGSSQAKEDAALFGARLLVFQNGTFNHPVTGVADSAQTVGTRIGGSLSNTFQPVGGAVAVQESATYRIAVQVTYTGLNQVVNSTQDFYIDDVSIKRNTVFNNVVLQDGKLQLKQLSFETGSEKYTKSGTTQTVDYYVGNPNVRILPDFKDTTTVTVIGTPYQTDPALSVIYKQHVYGGSDVEDAPVAMTLDSTAVLDNAVIVGADDVNDSFELDGDQTVHFTQSRAFTVSGSTGNNGAYTSTYSQYTASTDKTTVFVEEDVVSAVGDGSIAFTVPLQKWVYSVAAPVSRNKLRVKIDLASDGNGTAKLDYMRLNAPVEQVTREVTYSGGVQVFREATTGLSSDTSDIDTYVFPNSLFPEATATYDTFAAEFANEPAMRALSEVLSNTIKAEFLDDTTLPNLPVGKSIAARDSNWDIRIDNTGKVSFKEHIGKYYGKFAPKTLRKEYSFRKKNLTLIDAVEDGSDIINNLTYIAEGISGFNNIILDGDAFIDPVSVAKYGMRQGHISEKKTFDISVATSRAFALLREKAEPTLTVKAKLLPDFEDEWDVGDIIYFRDLDEELDDDFRVLSMSISVDDEGGESVDVVLSTKNKTVESFKASLEKQIATLNVGKQGSGTVATQGGTPEVISRDIPYIVAVDIPRDAEKNLQRVTLDMLTKPVFSTQNILSAGTHSHNVTIPGHSHTINFPQHSHPVDMSGLTFEVNGDVPAEDKTATATVDIGDTTSPAGVDSVQFGDVQRSDTLALTSGWTQIGASTNIGSGLLSTIDSFFVDLASYNDSQDPHPFKARIKFAQTGEADVLYPAAGAEALSAASALTTSTISTSMLTIKAPAQNLNQSKTVTITVEVQATSVNFTDEFVYTNRYTLLHIHGTNPDNHQHDITVSGSATATSTDPDGGGSQVVSESSTVASAPGGSHTHDTRFQLNHYRNVDNELLFPTNLHVSLNDVQGIGDIATGFNAGPMPELAGMATSETGDLTDSQKLAIGFSLDRQDISHAFKDVDGNWLIGRHFLTIRAPGNDNQVNAENLGILSAKVNLDTATDFHSSIV